MTGPIAGTPFDNPAADTIIRSKDGVNFRVRSGIIAEASPIFSDMFGIPLPEPGTELIDNPDYMDGKPVVAVEEDGATLDRLLRLCYPTADPVLTEVRDVRLVLAAAMKYDMDEAVALMKKALLTFVNSQPLRVWALACILRLEDEARTAAKALLQADLPTDAVPELQEVSAATYFRLVKFHRAKGDVSEGFQFTEPDPDDLPKTKCPRIGTDAEILYQNRPFADIICRSSDGQEFHTHKIILCAASPTLQKQILALPPLSEPSATNIIDLDARGAPLGSLLEMCYPSVSWKGLIDLPVHHALSMMEYARRFEMGMLFNRIRFEVFGHIKVAHSFLCYLLASSMGIQEITEDASAFLHADPFTYGCIPEMETTPAVAYHRLLVNRRRALAIASEMTSRVANTKASSGSVDAPPPQEDAEQAAGGDSWLQGILQRTAEELRSPHQYKHLLKGSLMSQTLQESVDRKLWCESCENNAKLILRIENIHVDVRNAVYANNNKLLNGE